MFLVCDILSHFIGVFTRRISLKMKFKNNQSDRDRHELHPKYHAFKVSYKRSHKVFTIELIHLYKFLKHVSKQKWFDNKIWKRLFKSKLYLKAVVCQ